MNLCGKFLTLTHVQLLGPSLYLDCLRPSDNDDDDDDEYNNTFSQRRREIDYHRNENVIHSENGFNFTKSYVDIRDYLSGDEPFVLYEYNFGFSKEDWCEEDPHPKLYVKSKTNVSGATSHTEQHEHTPNATIINYINPLINHYYFNNINVTDFPAHYRNNRPYHLIVEKVKKVETNKNKTLNNFL